MSLLIDALKKAEQEKKEAAKRLKEAQEKSGGRYELESRSRDQPTEQPVSPEEVKTGTDREAEKPEAPAGSETPESNLSLSPVDEESFDKELDVTHSHEISMVGEEKPPAFELKDITLENPEFSDDDAQDPDRKDLISPDSEKTFALAEQSKEDKANLRFDDTANVTLTGKYSKTLSESRVSRSQVSAAELAKDMGGGKEVPTPVAAQTVFSAVASSANRRQALEWIVFLGLFTMVLLAAGSFYYLKITPLTPETSSPLVAKGIEANQPAETVIALPEIITPEGQAGGTVTEATPSTQELPSTAVEANVEEQVQTMAKEEPPAEEPVAAVPPATPSVAAKQQAPLETVANEKAGNKDETATTGLPALPDEITVEPSVIAITRSRSVDVNDKLISSAYALYEEGKYNEAESEYRKVLDKLPQNRDALLGLAAIASRKGNIQDAYEKYLEVIKYYPRDVAARSALVSMQGGADPVKSESLVKVMLQDDPGAAFLYFTLGNIYAKQARWPEAQQAFFEAYRINSTNPDYVYNLAVSLDQIGQPKTALDYYHKALELADVAQAGFDSASVMTRIDTLASIPTQ